MPVVGNIDKKIGGLEILKDSFKYDIKTTHTKDEQKRREKNAPIRASLNTRLLEYKKKFKNIISHVSLARLSYLILC